MSLFRYLHPAYHHIARNRKVDKDLVGELDFEVINFQSKFEIFAKLKKKNCIGTSALSYKNKEKCPVYLSEKNCEEKHVDLLLIEEEGKNHYLLIIDFNTIMYNHTLHLGRKHFCPYCLQALSTAGILNCHINDCFKINSKKMINMSKKGEYVRFKNYERKIKSQFTIYVDFEHVLVPKDNGKQNSDGLCTRKYKQMLLAVMIIN